ncbi:coadhesin-like [Corticium candelabrum]|uniref:coadhesin-like n=1 Tax=Corticium candelabrum TaxID=121492 RepID=UPI002E26FF63|nr:coadhesin-like [Corticium candelabrum]
MHTQMIVTTCLLSAVLGILLFFITSEGKISAEPNYYGRQEREKSINMEIRDENRNRRAVEVDGQWGSWSGWTICTLQCTQLRARICDQPKPANGGLDCVGASFESGHCQPYLGYLCPIDGAWGAWTMGACTRSCGGGFRLTVRQCDNPPPRNGGSNCEGTSRQFETCSTQCCPVHGHWGEYSSWTNCEVSCGGGRRFRTRECNNPTPICDGNDCSGFGLDTERCSPDSCPVDGAWSEWTSAICSATCGTGTQQKFRKCDNPSPSPGGANCLGATTVFVDCSIVPCPVNGQWSSWSLWSTCPTCGQGHYKRRSRICDNPAPQYGGLPCPGQTTEASLCHLDICPVHGGWSGWTDFSDCPKPCNGSQYFRTRLCNDPPPNHGGLPCDGGYLEYQPCNTHRCPVNGGWSYWTEWTECTTTCARGGRRRSRSCDNPKPSYNGIECPSVGEEWAPCPGPRQCPLDGGWSSWSAFSPCTKSCGGGIKQTFRQCNNPTPRYDGLYCVGLSQKNCECNKQPCPVDGGWSHWGEWSSCSSTCKGGRKYRSRQCNNPLPQGGGLCCPGRDVDAQDCADVDCPVDGNWGSWSEWNECSESCEGGTRIRTRLCNNPAPDFGGKPCSDESRETGPCNVHPCPVNGGWSLWSEYTFCSANCSTGTQSRTRACDSPVPLYGGLACGGNDFESRLCNTFECPVDGYYQEWSDWSLCTRTCGTGRTSRTRFCVEPLYGGRTCESIGAPQESNECCERACRATQAYVVTSLVSHQFAKVEKYYIDCSAAGLGHCTRTRTVYYRGYELNEKVLYRIVTTEACEIDP